MQSVGELSSVEGAPMPTERQPVMSSAPPMSATIAATPQQANARDDKFSPRSAAAMGLCSFSTQGPENVQAGGGSITPFEHKPRVSPPADFEPPRPAVRKASEVLKKVSPPATDLKKTAPRSQAHQPYYLPVWQPPTWATPVASGQPNASSGRPKQHQQQPYPTRGMAIPVSMYPPPMSMGMVCHPMAPPPMAIYYPPMPPPPHSAMKGPPPSTPSVVSGSNNLKEGSRRLSDHLETPAAKRACIPYDRKRKSLALLAKSFCDMFESHPSQTAIVIDKVAEDLGVERRRIYDVINILESVQIVVRKGKNAYLWIGCEHLPRAFALLQNEAVELYDKNAAGHGLVIASNQQYVAGLQKMKDSRTLCRLSQHFLHVFLIGKESISLPEASELIHGISSQDELIAIGAGRSYFPETHKDPEQVQKATAKGMKTKIRRLYDIANVFLSIGILSKTEGKNKRPIYHWAYPLSVADIQDLYKKMPAYMRNEKTPFERQDSMDENKKALANIHQMGGAEEGADEDDHERLNHVTSRAMMMADAADLTLSVLSSSEKGIE